MARLILIMQEGRSLEMGSLFRILCMINALNKLLEGFTRNGLLEEIDGKDGAHPYQFKALQTGWRQLRSTIRLGGCWYQ